MDKIKIGDIYIDCNYNLRICIFRNEESDILKGLSFIYSDGFFSRCSIQNCGCVKISKKEIPVIIRLTQYLYKKANIKRVFCIKDMKFFISPSGGKMLKRLHKNCESFEDYIKYSFEILNTIRDNTNEKALNEYISLLNKLKIRLEEIDAQENT